MRDAETVPGIKQIVANALYRIAKPIDGDRCAGKISHQTFENSEIGCLIRGLKEFFGSDFDLTRRQVIESG
jgi:hypothetical protein